MTAKDLKTLIDGLNQKGHYLIKVDEHKYGVNYIITDKFIRLPRKHFCMPGRNWLSSVQLLKINKTNSEPFAVKYEFDYDEKTMFNVIQINDTKESFTKLSDYIERLFYGKKVDNNSLNLFQKLKVLFILTAYMAISSIKVKFRGSDIYEIRERVMIRPDFVLN